MIGSETLDWVLLAVAIVVLLVNLAQFFLDR
jgi:hypothetical protein